MIQGINIFTS